MKRAEFIENMCYLAYYCLKTREGDEFVSTNCYSVEEAKKIIANSGVEQGLVLYKLGKYKIIK